MLTRGKSVNHVVMKATINNDGVVVEETVLW